MSTATLDRHEAWVGEDLVVLDLAADQYLCAPSVKRRRPRAEAPSPADTSLPRGRDDLNRSERLALFLSLCDLARLYPGQTLGGLLAAVSRDRRPGHGDPETIFRLARAYQRLAIWLPISRKCLVRSFVLARLLQRCGQGCTWCIGVRTWPFAAHCWLEYAGVALDDRPERLCAYAVIHQVTV